MLKEYFMATDQIAVHPQAQIFPAAPAAATTMDSGAASPAAAASAAFGEDGFTFGDFLDIINPLQHIPIVSTIYRHITGDEIDPGARVLGDGLFGGIPGLVGGMVNMAVEQETGKDLGGHVIAMFDGDAEAAPTDFAALEAKPGTASGGDVPAPAAQAAQAAQSAQAAHAARQYAYAAEPDPIYGRTLDIGP
jgi:hypothetical protein